MKNLVPACLFLLALGCSVGVSAQATGAKRYVLLEHFTNSHCSICKSKNPAFYTLISQYPDDVHHIAYHPPVPYNDCIFYLANTTENAARAAIYGVDGTPRVALNGSLVPPGASLLPAATLQAALGQTSPIAIQVSDNYHPDTLSASIVVQAVAPVAPGDYRLFAAVVEKEVNKQTQNGETIHHDVFRKMIFGNEGLPIVGLDDGGIVPVISFSTPLAPTNWPNGEFYVLAFVVNTATGEVLNSGTRFDPLILDAGAPIAAQALDIRPNPVNDLARVTLRQADTPQSVQLFGVNGQRLQTTFDLTGPTTLEIPTAGLAPGIYLLKITGKSGVYTGKLVKE